MKKTVICTVCPNGCRVQVEYTCREDAVVSGNNKYCNIGGHSAALTHSGKRSVTRGIKKCYILTVTFNAVSTYMLCNSACFGICYGGVADCVKQ